MLFSILIANYNNGHFFEDCYKSILEQTYDDWEAIIVDDGSKDDSVEELQRLIEGDNRFKLFIISENKGCGYTKNRCASLAQGEILGFLDPNNSLNKNALSEMIKAFQANNSFAIVTSKFDRFDEI